MRRTVLLIDDSHDDRVLIERIFHDHQDVDFIAVADATAAETLLSAGGPRTEAIGWILLDFRIGRQGSLEFIRRIRSSSKLCRVPIIVLSGSMSPAELMDAYNAGASSCVLKPVGFVELREVIEILVKYWSRTVELPTRFY